MSSWPNAALGEVLTRSDDWIQLDPESQYKEVTVRNRGQGAVLRRIVTGAEIAGTRRMRVHHRQFIVSRIDARHGSSGVIPAGLEGAIVTNDFPVFKCDESVLLPEYLGWYTKTARFVDECRHASEGSTNRVRLKEPAFLEITMPLPPVEEQRRVVEKLNRLATLQQRAARMSVDAESKTSRLLPTAIDKLLHGRLEELPSGWNRIRVGDLGCPGVDTVQTGPFGAQLHKSDYRDEGHPVLAIGNVQWGFLDHSHVDHVSGDKATALARYALAEGDVLFTRSGTVGRSAVVPPLADGWLMTGHILRIRLDKCRALPRFVFLAMQGCSSVRSQIEEGARGATRAGFNTSLLSRIELPMPSIGEQEAIVRRLQILESQLGLVGRLQDSVSASYDALVHSALGTLLGR